MRPAILAFLLSLTTAAAAQDRRLDPIFAPIVKARANHGLVVAILEDGRERFLTYGSSGQDGLDLGPDALLEIGSITKTFTGALLADMALKGEVHLTDPVASLLPQGTRVPAKGRAALTLLDLATHCSGLPRMPTNLTPKNLLDPFADYTRDKLYAYLAEAELPRDPGASYAYSNLGMGLLGHALARRCGKAYEAAIKERILAPLKLADTTITLSRDQRRRLVPGHNVLGERTPGWQMDCLAGCGALRSTARDMLRYLKIQMKGAPKNRRLDAAMALARSPRRQARPGVFIGLGWHTLRRPGRRPILFHDGGTGGYRALAAICEDRAIIVLANFGDNRVIRAGFQALTALAPPAKPAGKRARLY